MLADTFRVKVSSVGASDTGKIFPGFAEAVCDGFKEVGIDDAFVIEDGVSDVALGTSSVILPLIAKVGDGGADSRGTEVPSGRATGTDIFAVPKLASLIGTGDVGEGAVSIYDDIAFVAGLTDSCGGIEGLALVIDLTANALCVEIEGRGAGKTGGIFPF